MTGERKSDPEKYPIRTAYYDGGGVYREMHLTRAEARDLGETFLATPGREDEHTIGQGLVDASMAKYGGSMDLPSSIPLREQLTAEEDEA